MYLCTREMQGEQPTDGWQVFTLAMVVPLIMVARNIEKTQFPPVWDLQSEMKQLIFSCNMLTQFPFPSFCRLSGILPFSGFLKVQGKTIPVEVGKCEWQEGDRERERTMINQINQNGVSGLNRTGSWSPLGHKWLCDLGHDTCTLWACHWT